MIYSTRRTIFFVLGWISMALGLIGIFVPIMPTTPFAILAAYLFSKSSERWHQWILNTPKLGPLVKKWEESRVIELKAKLISTFMILLLFSYTLVFVQVDYWIKGIVLISGIAVLLFIWTRPSVPR
jgi:uncharacterized protein